jgi:glycosyltransferase involved in cell wall biosynthesis
VGHGKINVPSLKYIYEPKRGSYRARNAGIQAAKGEIIAFTGADCALKRQKDG